MKLFGQSVLGPNVDHVVFPRADYDIIITARAILDDGPFYERCPKPKAPKIHKPGNAEWTEDFTDPDFRKSVENWASQRTAWTILESLKATPVENLEWEDVKYDQPHTWTLWQAEMKKAFFTENEIIQVMNLVWSVNGMSQDRLDEARLRFLAGQARPFKAPLSLKDEQQSIPSGEPANASA